jgi:hypothetical protein
MTINRRKYELRNKSHSGLVLPLILVVLSQFVCGCHDPGKRIATKVDSKPDQFDDTKRVQTSETENIAINEVERRTGVAPKS